MKRLLSILTLLLLIFGLTEFTRTLRAQTPGSVSISGVLAFAGAHQQTVTFDPSFTVDVCVATWKQATGTNVGAYATYGGTSATFYAVNGSGAPVYTFSSLGYICLGH